MHLQVREMQAAEAHIRIDYFHGASDEDLLSMGVGRDLLPSPKVWRASFEADLGRPLRHRGLFALVWELDGQVVGFSTADHITFGEEAFMHLHLLQPQRRRHGLGTEFVRRSAAVYFDVLELERLYCQPNAFNAAPNRTAQRAGFRYLFTHQAAPGPINFAQPMTRWVLDRHH